MLSNAWIAWGDYRVKFSYSRYRDFRFLWNILSHLIFTKLWGSSRAMHSCMCYPHLKRPWTVYIFILRFSARPFSGLVYKASSTPISLHPPSGAAGICLLFFCFKMCIPTPWIFACAGFSAVPDQGSILRDSIRSWGPFWWFHVSEIFGGG